MLLNYCSYLKCETIKLVENNALHDSEMKLFTLYYLFGIVVFKSVSKKEKDKFSKSIIIYLSTKCL